MPPKPSACAFLGHIPCIRMIRQCTGIKACESLDPRLNVEHEEVDSGHWTLANQIRNNTLSNAMKIKGRHFAQAAKDLWETGPPCFRPNVDCTLVAVKSVNVRNIY